MNIADLRADTHFLCGSTSGTYPDADTTRNINVAYNDVSRLIWESDNGWNYDDTNATTLPIAKTTMVHNQQDYSLPSTCQMVLGVEAQDSDGNWRKLKQFDPSDISIALPEYRETAGMPLYYDLIGRSVMLYPKPASASVTLTSGLAVYVNRDVTEIATTATTTVPGFAPQFHRILSYAAALDFTQDDQQRRFLMTQKARLEAGLVKLYSKRMKERPSAIKPHSKRRWRQYL